MPGWMKAHFHGPEKKGLPERVARNIDARTKARLHEAEPRVRRVVEFGTSARVIAMRVRNHGPVHRARGIYEKIASLAIEALL